MGKISKFLTKKKILASFGLLPAILLCSILFLSVCFILYRFSMIFGEVWLDLLKGIGVIVLFLISSALLLTAVGWTITLYKKSYKILQTKD